MKTIFNIFFFILSCSTLAEDSIKIGVSIPLSGPLAEYGNAIRNGYLLAKKNHPDKFKKLEFVFEDDQYKSSLAVTTFNKLISRDKVKVVFGWGNDTVLAVGPIAERKEIPYLFLCTHPKCYEGKKYSIGFINPAGDYSKLLVKQLKKQGKKNIAVIKSETSFFNAMVETLEKELSADQKFTLIDNYFIGDSDFKPSILKLKDKGYDALGLYVLAAQNLQFVKQTRQLNVKLPLFGVAPFESYDMYKEVYDNMIGTFYAHIHVEPAFRKKYVNEFKSDAQVSYAANFYDICILTADLLKNTISKITDEEILTLFSKKAEYQGEATGKFEFKDDGQDGRYFSFNLVLKEYFTNGVREIDG